MAQEKTPPTTHNAIQYAQWKHIEQHHGGQLMVREGLPHVSRAAPRRTGAQATERRPA